MKFVVILEYKLKNGNIYDEANIIIWMVNISGQIWCCKYNERYVRIFK